MNVAVVARALVMFLAPIKLMWELVVPGTSHASSLTVEAPSWSSLLLGNRRNQRQMLGCTSISVSKRVFGEVARTYHEIDRGSAT